jgi:hypothetical protein
MELSKIPDKKSTLATQAPDVDGGGGGWMGGVDGVGGGVRTGCGARVA